MNDITKLVVYSTAAASFSLAAHRSASRLGLPSVIVALVGGLALAALARANR